LSLAAGELMGHTILHGGVKADHSEEFIKSFTIFTVISNQPVDNEGFTDNITRGLTGI